MLAMENLKYPVIGCVERIGMLRMEGLQYTAISRKAAGKKCALDNAERYYGT